MKPSQSDSLARTRSHYEKYPFIEGGDRRVAHWKRRLKDVLPDEVVSGSSILDVGCGSGEIARGLSERGADVVGLDLTRAAVQRVRQTASGVVVCQGNALELPFVDGAFTYSVAIGVLHHTPHCHLAFSEMVRVSRERIVVLLYARWTPYHFAYWATTPLRARVPVERLERIPKWMLRVTRLIVAALTRQRLADRQLRRLLADQFWTPRATFHSAREVERWADKLRLQRLYRKAFLFHANLFVFEPIPKTRQSADCDPPTACGGNLGG